MDPLKAAALGLAVATPIVEAVVHKEDEAKVHKSVLDHTHEADDISRPREIAASNIAEQAPPGAEKLPPIQASNPPPIRHQFPRRWLANMTVGPVWHEGMN